MRSPADLRAWARRTWDRGYRSWLATPPSDLERTFVLHPPTEAEAGHDLGAVADWAGEWRRVEPGLGVGIRVDWVERRWRSLGSQRLPVRVGTTGVEPLARLAGREAEWHRGFRAAAALRERWPDQPELGPAIQRHGAGLVALSEPDGDCLVAVLAWLSMNPGSGLYARELPVNGVDTKWFEHHRSMVVDLATGLGMAPDLGLRRRAETYEVRILDPAVAPGTPRHFAASVEEIDRLPLAPSTVWIVENLTTLQSFPELPKSVAIHGSGYSVAELAGIRWLRAARVFYWGDLDTHGLAILSRARQHIPQIESALMDCRTLADHADLVVTEPRPVRREITHLTLSERDVLARLRDDDGRLEQERISWSYARKCIDRLTRQD